MPWLLIGLFAVLGHVLSRAGGSTPMSRPIAQPMRGGTRSANLAMLLRLAWQLHRLYRQSAGEGGIPARVREIEAARRLLGVSAGATREEINAAYRELMRRHHPDQGGNADTASRLNRARDCLLQAA